MDLSLAFQQTRTQNSTASHNGYKRIFFAVKTRKLLKEKVARDQSSSPVFIVYFKFFDSDPNLNLVKISRPNSLQQRIVTRKSFLKYLRYRQTEIRSVTLKIYNPPHLGKLSVKTGPPLSLYFSI